MNNLDTIPFEILKTILEFVNTRSLLLSTRLINKHFYDLTMGSITFLDGSVNPNNDIVRSLTNLTSINLCDNTVITDSSVQHLTNLTSIYLDVNAVITNETLKHLPYLVQK